MNEKFIMPLSNSDGITVELDLCCFCKKLKDISKSGDCKHYDTDFVWDKCIGYEKVDDIKTRMNEILTHRGK